MLKYRLSNVLAWAGFTFAPIALFLVFAVSIELIPQKSPPETCETCEVLTWDDVASSPYLQRMQIQAGDWVVKEGKPPEISRIVRSRPLWAVNAKDFRDEFGKGFADIFAPHASLWLLAALINYVMVGSLRILPWRKIRQAR
jgi:hypothetical protein